MYIYMCVLYIYICKDYSKKWLYLLFLALRACRGQLRRWWNKLRVCGCRAMARYGVHGSAQAGGFTIHQIFL